MALLSVRPKPYKFRRIPWICGCSSAVERQLPKLNVRGSTPLTRSNNFNGLGAYSQGAIWFGSQTESQSDGIYRRIGLTQISPSDLMPESVDKKHECLGKESVTWDIMSMQLY